MSESSSLLSDLDGCPTYGGAMQTTNSSGGTKSSAFIFTTLTLVHNMCRLLYQFSSAPVATA